jgi:exodeoxyribonuclease VII large subunit
MTTRTIFSVTAFTQLVKEELESRFPSLSVKGEVSNLKVQSSGHIYFTLKDAEAQVSCVLFRLDAKSLLAPLKEGDEVVIDGELTLYPPRGAYQIVVRRVTPQGVGALLLKFQALKRELEEKGWFSKDRKRPLPKFPKRIGVVTSPTGAVIRDILNILSRRVGNFQLILCPAKVQGEGAALEIAEAIAHFNQYRLADVLIVGRGGGSFEDLFPFNELPVAKAIFESEIPIISAVGHETDFTISDFVADFRAPTPSAAAEIVLQEKAALLTEVEKAKKFLDRHMMQFLSFNWERVERLTKTLKAQDPRHQLKIKREKIKNLTDLLDARFQKVFKKMEERFGRVKDLIEAINPERLLEQGYSILFTERGGHVIRDISQLAETETLLARLKGGEASLSVIKLFPQEKI